MKDRDKINWPKVGELLSQHDACLRASNDLECLENTEAARAIEEIRREIVEEIGGKDTKGE